MNHCKLVNNNVSSSKLYLQQINLLAIKFLCFTCMFLWWLNISTSKLLHFTPLIHINLTFWHLSSCAWPTWFVASQPICAPLLVLHIQAPTYATRPIFATFGNATLKGEKLQLDVRKPTLLCFYNLSQN